jgi:hypothetical protein
VGQRLLGRPLLVPIVEEAADTKVLARPHDVGGDRHMHLVAFPVHQAHLARSRPLGGAGRGSGHGQVVVEPVEETLGNEELRDRTTEHLVTRPSEEQLGLAVPLGQDRSASVSTKASRDRSRRCWRRAPRPGLDGVTSSSTAIAGPLEMSPPRCSTVTPVAVRVRRPGDRSLGRPPGVGPRGLVDAGPCHKDACKLGS